MVSTVRPAAQGAGTDREERYSWNCSDLSAPSSAGMGLESYLCIYFISDNP